MERRIKEHRVNGAINGRWREPDPVTGPECVDLEEMLRRTIERQTGEVVNPEDMGRVRAYNFKTDRRQKVKGLTSGTVYIRLRDK